MADFFTGPIYLLLLLGQHTASCDGVANGEYQSRLRYESAYVANSSACAPEEQTRICTNGSWSDWSGEFAYSSCRSVPGSVHYVDQNDSTCSDELHSDSELTPYCTISASAAAAGAGDYVVIKEGIYREPLVIPSSGTEGVPIVYEAFNGEDVAIDGSVVVDGWTQCGSAADCFGNPNWQNIYHTTISFHTDKLFENNVLMTNSREPDFGYIQSTKSETGMAVLSGEITEPTDYYLGAFVEFQGTTTTAVTDHNNLIYDKYYVTNSEPGKIYVDYSEMTPLWGHSFDVFLDEIWFYLRNKVQYIDRAGEWALIDYLGDAPYTLYFWPPSGNPSTNLIEAASLNMLISANSGLENVEFHGIDAQKVNKYPALNNGSAYTFRYGAKNVVIKDSTIMFAEKAMEARHIDGLYIQNNTISNNYNGLVLGSGLSGPAGNPTMSIVEGNDIGPNSGDGIQIYSESNITIRNNHIHHHHSDRKHADNVQTRSVNNIIVENNTIHDGGQNIIMQNTDNATITGNLIFNSHARSLILDSAMNDNLLCEGNTVGYSHYSLLIRNTNTVFHNNVYALGAHIPTFFVHDYLDRITSSDYNYYDDVVISLAHGNPWTHYSITEWQDLSHDEHSLFGGSTFANIPLGLYNIKYFSNRDDLKVDNADSIFLVGDIIEYGNDGIAREVISVDSDSIGISPPLAYDTIGSMWGNYVALWRDNTNVTEDYTPSGNICSRSTTGNYLGAVPCVGEKNIGL